MPQESANVKSIPDAKKTDDLPESTLTVQEAIDLIGNSTIPSDLNCSAILQMDFKLFQEMDVFNISPSSPLCWVS